MRIGGLQRFTLADYPGKTAAVVFTQGCNYRCGYCHNPQLVLPQLFNEPIPLPEVFAFLQKRRGQLQGVVLSGGEPTIHHDLPEFIRDIKEMGFAVKLDTNGSNSHMLDELIHEGLLDYIAMDIKTSWVRYEEAAGVPCDSAKLRQSIRLIMECGLPYQFRTTLVKSFCSPDDLREISTMLGKARGYVLQPFVLSVSLVSSASLQDSVYTPFEMSELAARFAKY